MSDDEYNDYDSDQQEIDEEEDEQPSSQKPALFKPAIVKKQGLGGDDDDAIASSVKMPPSTAILFLRRRCQASCHSEWPASSSSVGRRVAGCGAAVMSVKAQFRVQPDLEDVHQQVQNDD